MAPRSFKCLTSPRNRRCHRALSGGDRPDTPTGAELVNQEREFLASEGWKLHREGHVPEAWVADRDGVEDFIRFGTVEAMREAAMGGHTKGELIDSGSTFRRSMVVQISPPGPPEPG